MIQIVAHIVVLIVITQIVAHTVMTQIATHIVDNRINLKMKILQK